MERNHFQSTLKKPGSINHVLDSRHGHLRNKVETLTQTLNSLMFYIKVKSTPSGSVPDSVPEGNPDAESGRKTLTQTDKESEYPQENGHQVQKLTWPVKLFGCRL